MVRAGKDSMERRGERKGQGKEREEDRMGRGGTRIWGVDRMEEIGRIEV